MMKILGTKSVLFGAAILAVGASAGPAFAGEIHGWASCGACGGGYAYASRGGYGYGGCFGCGASCYGRLEYDRYIVGHGPMYPAGDILTGYSYGAPSPTKTPPTPNTSPVPSTTPVPNGQ